MSTKLQRYCLQWLSYTTHVTDLVLHLLDINCLVDVTLCVEHQTIHAHRIILAACSTFFQDIFASFNDAHPIIILCDMSYEDVKAVVEFMYRGELSIDSEKVPSVLQVARELKVCGLMEVSGQGLGMNLAEDSFTSSQEEENECISEDIEMSIEAQQDCESTHNETESTSNPENDVPNFCEQTLEATEGTDELQMVLCEDKTNAEKRDEHEKRNKHKRDSNSKRAYSDLVMDEALEELRSGRNIQEISELHKIPRSTLYLKARSLGIPSTCNRQEHSVEKMSAALLMVTGGCSLQQASKHYNIPKSVLWRRMQKEGEECMSILRSRSKSRCDNARKQEAIQALENGENISKVSTLFKIPKTTVFREKSRLIEAGKLPPINRPRKRNPSGDGLKEQRLAEAVAACKGGKMSQAAASSAFKVSKSTIWRRLQSMKDRMEDVGSVAKEPEKKMDSLEPDIVVQLSPDSEFDIGAENNVEIAVTYIDDSDFTDASLIILSSGDTVETISSQIHDSQIIVDSGGNQKLEKE